MITIAEAREIALAMPEAEEGAHMDHPDFRVWNKIFATLWPDESRAVVFTDPGDHERLLQSSPEAFSLNGWSERCGALDVHLGHIAAEEFHELVATSWRRKAPKSLLAEGDQT